MKSYIGAKIIQAEPCDELRFAQEHGRDIDVIKIDSSGNSRPGYKVVYPDGYTSWSPKDVFENAYRLVTDGEKRIIAAVYGNDDPLTEECGS